MVNEHVDGTLGFRLVWEQRSNNPTQQFLVRRRKCYSSALLPSGTATTQIFIVNIAKCRPCPALGILNGSFQSSLISSTLCQSPHDMALARRSAISHCHDRNTGIPLDWSWSLSFQLSTTSSNFKYDSSVNAVCRSLAYQPRPQFEEEYSHWRKLRKT